MPVRASLFGDDLTNRQARNGGQPFAVVDGIAVIEIAGTLVHRGAWIGQSSGLTSYEGIAAQLQAALADPAIRGIALDIDSFGGEVAGAFDLADRIRAVRQVKPVQAFVADHALSAAYALAGEERGPAFAREFEPPAPEPVMIEARPAPAPGFGWRPPAWRACSRSPERTGPTPLR